MVRLKEEEPIWLRFVNNSFQFQYGAIKSPIIATSESQKIQYFNSNMVRLKVEIAISTISSKLQFQFQYGAIKRMYASTTAIQRT